MLGVEELRRVRIRLLVHQIVPVLVAAGDHLDVVLCALDDDDVLDRGVTLAERLVDGRLERGRLATPVSAVGGDDDLRFGVHDPRVQGIGGEPAEDD